MDEQERGSIEGACRQLMMRYAAAMDLQDWELFLTVFADEFVWTRPGTRPMTTPAQVRAFFENMWRIRREAHPHYIDVHLITTCSIEVESADRARGYTWCMMYTATEREAGRPAPMPAHPEMIVLYRDVFAPGPGGWRIIRHDAEHQFLSAGYVRPPVPAGQERDS